MDEKNPNNYLINSNYDKYSQTECGGTHL